MTTDKRIDEFKTQKRVMIRNIKSKLGDIIRLNDVTIDITASQFRLHYDDNKAPALNLTNAGRDEVIEWVSKVGQNIWYALGQKADIITYEERWGCLTTPGSPVLFAQPAPLPINVRVFESEGKWLYGYKRKNAKKLMNLVPYSDLSQTKKKKINPRLTQAAL